MSETALIDAALQELLEGTTQTLRQHKDALVQLTENDQANHDTLRKLWDRVNEACELLNRHSQLLEANRFLTLLMWRHLGLPEDDQGQPKPTVH